MSNPILLGACVSVSGESGPQGELLRPAVTTWYIILSGTIGIIKNFDKFGTRFQFAETR